MQNFDLMKKYFILILIALITFNTYAQDPPTENTGDLQGVITTGVPFMLIAGDARAAGLADIGVVTSADAFFAAMESGKICICTEKTRDWCYIHPLLK